MSSLTTCLKKAGSAIHADDKSAILARAGALRKEGLSPAEASMRAVDEQIAAVARLIEAKASAGSGNAAPTQATQAKPLDHGELNIPGRTRNLDAEIDKQKAAIAAKEKADAKASSQQNKADKAAAKELHAQIGGAMVEKMAPGISKRQGLSDKEAAKQIAHTIDQMVKWEPAKFIALAKKFQEENAGGSAEAAATELPTESGADSTKLSIADGEPGRNAERAAISQEELNSVISVQLKDWKGVGVENITPVESWQNLPEEALQSAERREISLSSIEGFQHGGKVYLVRSAITSAEQAQRILFHEVIGHMGLRASLEGKPNATLDAIWHKLNGLDGISKLAKKLDSGDGVTVWDRLQPYLQGEYATPGERRTVIMHELIAFAAQANDASMSTRFKAYLADLKAAVLKALRSLGLDRLAARVDQVGGEYEALALVRDARRSIVTGKTKSGRPFVFVVGGEHGGDLSVAQDGAKAQAAERNALKALSETDELFRLPKSDKTTLEGIAADIDPGIKVRKMQGLPGRTDYTLTMPDGNTARLVVRPANPYGSNTYGFDLEDGEAFNVVSERPGENPEDVDPTKEDVWLDVSLLKPGEGGSKVYAIAAALAHNTGRIFIGDPAGLSDDALLRRPEQMLSSALKYGTTEHLAPHPRQIAGDKALGVPGLKWVYGDDLGNIRRLIDLNLKVAENYGHGQISFSPKTGQYLDSSGENLSRGGIAALGKSGLGRQMRAGSATLERGAVLRALLREEGGQNGSRDGRSAGILERIVSLNAQQQQATKGLFYSIQPGVSAASPQTSGQAGFDLPEFGAAAKSIELVQNRYNRWKQTIEAIKAQNGSLTEANDFYAAEERYWGIVGAKMDDFKGEVKQFVKDVQADGLELSDVALYAYAKHAPERNAQIAKINDKFPDGGSGMTNAEAAAIIAQAKKHGTATNLERHAKQLNAWTSGTRDVLLQNGLISQDELNQWTGAYQNYVPLRGQVGNDGSRRGTGSGFDIRGKESIRAMGRSSKASNIIEHIMQDRSRAVMRAGKNEVMRSFARFVLDNPDPKLWEVNKPAKSRSIVTTPSGEQQVVEHENVNKAAENTVALKDGGQTIYITVHDETLVKQLKNLHAEQALPVVLMPLAMSNRYMSTVYTSLSPAFIILNAARDVSAGTVNMVGEAGFGGAGKMLTNLPKAYIEAFRSEVLGKRSAAYEQYRLTGGKTGFMDFKDIEGYAKELTDFANDSQGWGAALSTPGGMAKAYAAWRRLSRPARRLIGKIEDVNAAVENATRFAAFKASMESGKTVAQAANISKNITVNFNRRGSMGPALGAWFLFFNPAVQGTARLAQALSSRKVLATVGTGMAGIMALALANAELGGDDDGDGMSYWDKIPDEVKERNLIIMLPPGSDSGESVPGTKYGKYIKIPMPYGYNVFAVAAYTAADLLRNQSNPAAGVSMGKAMVRLARAFAGSFIPIPGLAPTLENSKAVSLMLAPSALSPLVQSMTNINGFGRQMYPDGNSFDKKPPDSEKVWAAQKDTWKHNVARYVNEATGGSQYHEGMISVTPATIDNMVRSYGGGIASFISAAADTLVTQGVNRDSFEWWRAPIIKNLYGEVDAAESQSMAYDRLAKIEEGAMPLKQAKKGHDFEAAKAIRAEYGQLAELGGVAESVRESLSKIRKQEINIIESESRTDKEKNAYLRVLEGNRKRQYDRVNKAFNDALVSEAQLNTP